MGNREVYIMKYALCGRSVHYVVVCFPEVRGLRSLFGLTDEKPHKYYANTRAYNLTKMAITKNVYVPSKHYMRSNK